ncbi:MAG: HtaA domain-containing protein [Pseudonocardia sp.]|nr:HtaA domain-containing protein [Pseudonocardia sp.]
MRLRRTARLSLLLVTLGAASIAVAAPASATETDTITLASGATVLEIDSATAGVLGDNGVSVTTVGAAYGEAPVFAFPVEGGEIDPTTAAGTVEHDGGLEFAAGDISIEVDDFVIDTGEGVLTAEVDDSGTRVPLLKLDTSAAGVYGGDGGIVITGVEVSLTAEAAAALNATFDVELFAEDLAIGTTVTAAAAH